MLNRVLNVALPNSSCASWSACWSLQEGWWGAWDMNCTVEGRGDNSRVSMIEPATLSETQMSILLTHPCPSPTPGGGPLPLTISLILLGEGRTLGQELRNKRPNSEKAAQTCFWPIRIRSPVSSQTPWCILLLKRRLLLLVSGPKWMWRWSAVRAWQGKHWTQVGEDVEKLKVFQKRETG